ncbi:MAG: hypothetical protein ACE5L7_06020 [Candidatus Aminicenantales bacterium]
MKSTSFPKTWHWQCRDRKKGTISPIAIFTFLVFSILGLGMLYLSQLHLKFSAYKKNSTLLDCASENGIKKGFAQLISLLSEASSPIVISPEELSELREDAAQDGKKLIEKTLGTRLPLQDSGSWDDLYWTSHSEFLLNKIEDKDGYFKFLYSAIIHSEGKIKSFFPKRISMLESEMELFAGTFALPKIPFLLEKKLNQEQRKNFTQIHNIEITRKENNAVAPHAAFSEEKLIPQQADAQLMKALKIKIFYPQNLSRHQLRNALGLEESDEPVPEGVYLIQDDLGLGGVFVQGDLQEMIFAIEQDFQVVSFRTEKGLWILKFSPTKGKTHYSTPTEHHFFDLIPLGIIIVNGAIRSLGGGVVDPYDRMTLIKEEGISSILQGVNITIICSDEITISSHLIHQGIKWQEGIPYIKDTKSQLIIFAAGEDLLEKSEREGRIIIDENSPEEIKIQASLTASGKGVSIEGEKKTVHILGSLQTSDLRTNENKLKIIYDERNLDKEELLQFAPKTTKPILYLSSFRPKEWKEY